MAESESKSSHALRITLLPVKDVIIQTLSAKVQGSDPERTEKFELHALISWNVPQPEACEQKLEFSAAVTSVYLVKEGMGKPVQMDAIVPAEIADQARLDTRIKHRYNWIPARPTEVRTLLSLEMPNPDQARIQHFPDGENIATGNGFEIKGKAGESESQRWFEFTVSYEGEFDLDGVKYVVENLSSGQTTVEYNVAIDRVKVALPPNL